LTHLVYSGVGDSALLNLDSFLSAQSVALHTLVIRHSQRYPASFLPTTNLCNLYLTLGISNADFLSQLLAQGRQLENLRLEVNLEHGCMLSTVFHAYAMPNSFPTLRKLSFVLMGAATNMTDPDLFPSIAQFVRGYGTLDALCISNIYDLAGFGYDAGIWGVLPSFLNLRTLLIDVTPDMPPALAAWLIPRSVTVLEFKVSRQATIDINVGYFFFRYFEHSLSCIVPSNYGVECQTDLSFLACLSALRRFKSSFAVVSLHSASCDSGQATYTPFTVGTEKGNWNTGLIGGKDFTLMITWTSWTVENYVFSIQGSRGLCRLFTDECYFSIFCVSYYFPSLGVLFTS